MQTQPERLPPEVTLLLKDRALSVADEGITIADARLPGRPLIYVNEGFERLTGYARTEALGRNCKFLQGDDADPGTVQEIRDALVAGRSCSVEILNRRKDGVPFWNRLSITPVRDDAGELTHFIGVQSDITARREAEERLRRANAKMRRNLEEAAAIQQAWLPDSLPRAPGFTFAWKFRPCDELAGDSLNVLRLDERHVALYVLDVCGHGVPAALLSASLNRWLSPSPEQSCLFRPAPDGVGHEPAEPADVVATLNRHYGDGPETGKFFTILYGVLDLKTRKLRYATAGHPPPVRITEEGATLAPAARGLPVGVLPDFDYRQRSLQLEPGERLLLYTDGALEAVDADDQELGQRRMLEVLAGLHGEPADASLDAMVRTVEDWCPDGRPQDDVSLLLVDVDPA